MGLYRNPHQALYLIYSSASERTRTFNPRGKNPLLYTIELQMHFQASARFELTFRHKRPVCFPYTTLTWWKWQDSNLLSQRAPVLQTGTTHHRCRISIEVTFPSSGNSPVMISRQPATFIGAFTNITVRTKDCLWPSTTLQLEETLVLPLL